MGEHTMIGISKISLTHLLYISTKFIICLNLSSHKYIFETMAAQITDWTLRSNGQQYCLCVLLEIHTGKHCHGKWNCTVPFLYPSHFHTYKMSMLDLNDNVFPCLFEP